MNQKYLYPDANALENTDNFNENVPATQKDTSDEGPEKEMSELNYPTEAPPFSAVIALEIIARRTSIKRETLLGRHRQALTRTQHPPIKIDEDHEERVPCTLVPEGDQNYERDILVVSHNNISRTENI